MKKLFLILAFLSALTSCKSKDQSGGLSVTMSPSGAYALTPDTFSCAQISQIDTNTTASIKGRRVLFGKPVFTWTDTARYVAIDQIVLSFNSPYLTNQIFVYENIDITEFRGILGGSGGAPTASNTPGWDASLNAIIPATAAGATTVKAKCEVRVGGITIPDTSPSFRAQGLMKVFGRSIEYDSSQNVVSEQPVFTQTSVYFDYTKYD